ncbi:MAG: SDR family NAD(P)-dependent oxidoreductase [Anaerolineales bacterium]|nr:SDR family NAD(P)-dependent oxidoreductase [Anaerolineales bacterium]
MELKNKKILVTGASRGIGRAIALALLGAGAEVYLTARSEESFAFLREGAAARTGKAHAGRLDLASPESIREGADRAFAVLGGIDILVNNAGITSQSLVVDQDPEQAEREVRVNYLGAYRLTRAVLPRMLERGSGMIVNVSSTIGSVPSPTQANYCATKAALVAFSEALRGEVEDRGIDVRVFLPGHTQTEMGRSIRLKTPQRMTAEEVAAHFLRALRSKRAVYVCGGANEGIIRIHRMFPEAARRIMKDIALGSFRSA